MAAIDSLLRLMGSQGAEELVLVSDAVPTLRKSDSTVSLSMPAVPGPLVSSFAREVVGEEGAHELAAGATVAGTYRSADGSSYSFEVMAVAGGCRLRLAPVNGTHVAAGPPAELPRRERAGITASVEASPARDGSESPSPDPTFLGAIADALERGASDVLMSTGQTPRLRVAGSIEELHGQVVERRHILGLVEGALDGARSRELEDTGSVDLALELRIDGARRRFRASLFHHHGGLAVTLRPIRERPPTFDELALPLDLRDLGGLPFGLVLVTGAAGSGKSTTLAALVDHINRTRAAHVITLEDPIEFEHTSERSMVHQREVGRDVRSFSEGLRAALRECPDVILVGEMRDLDTIEAALTAAETGHLVLSTLHTGNAAAAIDRIIDVFEGHRQPQVRLQVASVLRAVVTQVLVPSVLPPQRVAAVERLVVTDAVACQIRDGRSHQVSSLIQAGGADGMVTLERSLAQLVRESRVSLPMAMSHARDVASLSKLVRAPR